jgi:hypothetical protein
MHVFQFDFTFDSYPEHYNICENYHFNFIMTGDEKGYTDYLIKLTEFGNRLLSVKQR